MTREIINIDYHRNGVSGEGFWVATFTDVVDGTKRNMMAVTFTKPDSEEYDPIRTAIFDTDLMARGDCRFVHNSWRGDYWHGWMVEQIEKARADMLRPREHGAAARTFPHIPAHN